MKQYSVNSVMTIRQKIQKLANTKRKNDLWVDVYYNGSSEGSVLGFYLSDWGEFQEHKELDYRLDTETRSAKNIHLGFNAEAMK